LALALVEDLLADARGFGRALSAFGSNILNSSLELLQSRHSKVGEV
jgi:hypothetical protein